MLHVYISSILKYFDWEIQNMADLKGCPFGQDIKNDCKNCDYGDTNHFDASTGKCVKR